MKHMHRLALPSAFAAATLALFAAPASATSAAEQYRADVAYCRSAAVEPENRSRCLFEAQAAQRRNQWQDRGARDEDGQAMPARNGGAPSAADAPASEATAARRTRKR